MNAYTYRTTAGGEPSRLKTQCSERGILVATQNSTPSDVIPLVEQRLADHQNHFAKTMDPTSGDHLEWKSIHDDLTAFLHQLRPTDKFAVRDEVPFSLSAPDAANLQPAAGSPNPPLPSVIKAPTPPPANPPKNISAQNAGLSGSTVANQQPTAGSMPVSAGSMPGFAGSAPVSAGSEPPPTPLNTRRLRIERQRERPTIRQGGSPIKTQKTRTPKRTTAGTTATEHGSSQTNKNRRLPPGRLHRSRARSPILPRRSQSPRQPSSQRTTSDRPSPQ